MAASTCEGSGASGARHRNLLQASSTNASRLAASAICVAAMKTSQSRWKRSCSLAMTSPSRPPPIRRIRICIRVVRWRALALLQDSANEVALHPSGVLMGHHAAVVASRVRMSGSLPSTVRGHSHPVVDAQSGREHRGKIRGIGVRLAPLPNGHVVHDSRTVSVGHSRNA
jgi:hypothetical protein